MKMLWGKVLLCCLMLTVLVSCDQKLQDQHFIFKRESTVPKCQNGGFNLCEGAISKADPTTKTIKQEAMEKKTTKLYSAYTAMTTASNYKSILSKGAALGLSTDETEAVRLYTMDSLGLYQELNTALREGEEKYPVLHYWLQSALIKLPKSNSNLYRGYKKKVNVNVGTTLHLPGFTSTSNKKSVAQGFSSPGCTLMRFDSSRNGGSVSDLSQFPGESEILIPPSEVFVIYNTSYEGSYHYVYLRPSTVTKRSTSVFTLCESSAHFVQYSPLLISTALIFGVFRN